MTRIHKITTFAAALAIGAPLTVAFTASAGATGEPGQPMPHAVKAKNCKGKQLRVSFGKAGAAAGTFHRTIKFRNNGKRCALRAWPQVGYATKHGRPVGFLARPAHKLRWPLVLRHGNVGRVDLGTPEWANYPRGRCAPRRAAKLAIYVPGRINAGARHLKRVPNGPMKVCTTRLGRPSLSRLH